MDDHRDAADAMAALLESSGHEVASCYDGPSALEVAKNYRPEAMILDIGLPGMDGYEVARRLRQMLPDGLLIALTGWVDEEDSARARVAGFDYYLAKPVQFTELQKLLTNRKRPDA